MGTSPERMVQAQKQLEILDVLFREASFANGLSSKTYLQQAQSKFKHQRVEYLKNQLKQLLKIK
jgi:hypothetical protein